MPGRPLPPLRLLRLANPVVRRVLGSRLHRALSGRLLVLTYRGHRTGRTFRIPLRYAELSDGRLVVVAVQPSRKLWWRSFRSTRDAVITFRGTELPATGLLADGPARDDASAAYTARYRRSGRLLADAALVVFERSG